MTESTPTRSTARQTLSAEQRAAIFAECGCDPKEFAPPHFPSDNCQSGGYPHCSCNRCF